jgi:hypothetical protein
MKITVKCCKNHYRKSEVIKYVSELIILVDKFIKKNNLSCFLLEVNHVDRSLSVSISIFKRNLNESPIKIPLSIEPSDNNEKIIISSEKDTFCVNPSEILPTVEKILLDALNS